MVFVAATLLLAGCGGGQGTKRLPAAGFKVAFESHGVAAQMRSGERVVADVMVKNISPVTWPSKPNAKNLHAVNLAYHWLDRKGRMAIFDGERTPLPYDLKPGDSVTLKALIQPPEKAGSYTLEITLVQEGVAWFPEKGGAKLSIPVEVSAAAAGIPPGKAEKTVVGRGQRGGPWSVQIASYPEKKIADESAKKMKDRGYDAYVVSAKVGGQAWHQVRIGQLARYGSPGR
jgi:hypothetical protein